MRWEIKHPCLTEIVYSHTEIEVNASIFRVRVDAFAEHDFVVRFEGSQMEIVKDWGEQMTDFGSARVSVFLVVNGPVADLFRT